MVKKIKCSLKENSYPIYVGPGAISQIREESTRFLSQRAFIISDEKLRDARSSLIGILKGMGWIVVEITVQAGEELKDFQQAYSLYGQLFQQKANRDSVLFALGGGTIGDVTGFVGSTYLRGIQWVGVPTTLLAQIDSSIGGKTGINYSDKNLSGKNLIGSVYQPSLVLCDTNFLKTLSSREVVSGFGEMIKYGFIFDPKLFHFIRKEKKRILSLEQEPLSYAIQKCIQWKVKTIQKDPLERKGIREVLNFGHTFGHALESLTHYQVFQHGEAVIWGMRFALALSEVRKRITSMERKEWDLFLSQLSISPLPKELKLSDFIPLMVNDKKVKDGKIRFVLLKKLGESIFDTDVSVKELCQAFEWIAQ